MLPLSANIGRMLTVTEREKERKTKRGTRQVAYCLKGDINVLANVKYSFYRPNYFLYNYLI